MVRRGNDALLASAALSYIHTHQRPQNTHTHTKPTSQPKLTLSVADKSRVAVAVDGEAEARRRARKGGSENDKERSVHVVVHNVRKPPAPHHEANRRSTGPHPTHARKKGASTSDSTAISLMRMLREGPEVSLSGSPTVSPMTAACVRERGGQPSERRSVHER